MTQKIKIINEENTQEFEIEVGETLWDGVKACGTELAHGCLAGSCGACRVDIVEGIQNFNEIDYIENVTVTNVKKMYHETMEAEKVDKMNIRLACRAKVNGPIKFKPLP